MTLFQIETELSPNTDTLPTARLESNASLSVYDTPLLKEFSEDIQLLWSLAASLQKEQGIQHWIRDLVFPGLESRLELNRKQHSQDPFNTVFAYLSFGQHDLACEEAKRLGDFQLAMFITHSESKDVRTTVQDQIRAFQKEEQWKQMTRFHKSSWYVIAGDLGYQQQDEFTVTDRVSWQCTLGMYIWFGNRQGQPVSLSRYNHAIDTKVSNLHHLTTVKHTAQPDQRCLWYQLLQWYSGDSTLATLEEWPLDLVWLLGLYMSNKKIDTSFAMTWIEDLERMDLAELAIYAALFLPR